MRFGVQSRSADERPDVLHYIVIEQVQEAVRVVAWLKDS